MYMYNTWNLLSKSEIFFSLHKNMSQQPSNKNGKSKNIKIKPSSRVSNVESYQLYMYWYPVKVMRKKWIYGEKKPSKNTVNDFKKQSQNRYKQCC